MHGTHEAIILVAHDQCMHGSLFGLVGQIVYVFLSYQFKAAVVEGTAMFFFGFGDSHGLIRLFSWLFGICGRQQLPHQKQRGYSIHPQCFVEG